MGSKSSIRVLLGFLVVALAGPLLVLTATFGYRTFQAERGRAEGRLMGLADAAASGVYQFIQDSRQILQGVVESPAVRSLDPSRCSEVFPGLEVALTSVYSNISTWREDGTPVCSILPAPPATVDVVGAPGFQEALHSDGFFIAPVQRGTRNNRWIAVFALPIHDLSGMRAGMASLSVDLVRFEEILVALNLPADGLVSLTELGGTVVARSVDSEEWVGRSPPASDARSRDDPTFAVRGASRAKTFDGIDFSWGFVRVPGTEWVVYAGLPTSEVLGPVWNLRARLAGIVGLALVGAALLGLVVYRHVARPLQGLVDGISSSLAGDPAPLPTDGPAEIALLADHLNRAWLARARAEQQRERADERARSLVENAVMGIVVSTEDGRFIDANQAMADLLGYDSPEEVLAQPVDAIYETSEHRADHLRAHGDLPAFRGIPVTWKKKDGTPIHVRLSGRRFVLEDVGVAWETFVEDVTEVTRLQAQAAQLQKMEALGRLAGGIAHDFNNLLTVVQGQADLLRDDPTLPALQKEAADDIYTAAARGAALNRQLLAFGRRSPSTKRRLDINQVIRSFELVLRRAAGEDRRFNLALAADLSPVLADRSRLEQVLMNLVVNARDAMPDGGALTVATGESVVEEADRESHPEAKVGAHVVLSVTDTGVGITPEVLPHIFEPFYTTKPSAKGTGLGLATVYGIVADAGGHIRVDSAPDEGTTFRVFWPTLEGDEAEESTPAAARPRRSGQGVVLLVEDEGGVRRLAQRILEKAGYRVIAAADGREALEIAACEGDTIDLLLTDVVMPGMRGPEVAAALAASGAVRRAVLFSGYPEGLTDEGPAGVPAWTFLAKPFTPRQLLDAVELVLGREI